MVYSCLISCNSKVGFFGSTGAESTAPNGTNVSVAIGLSRSHKKTGSPPQCFGVRALSNSRTWTEAASHLTSSAMWSTRSAMPYIMAHSTVSGLPDLREVPTLLRRRAYHLFAESEVRVSSAVTTTTESSSKAQTLCMAEDLPELSFMANTRSKCE